VDSLRFSVLILLVATFPGPLAHDAAASPATPAGQPAGDARVVFGGQRYQLDRAADLRRLHTELAERVSHAGRLEAEWKFERDARLNGRALAERSPLELKRHFQRPEQVPWPREIRCLEQLAKRVERLPAESSTAGQRHRIAEIRELAAALQNTRRDPVPRIDMFTVPFLAIDFLDNSIGGGERESGNIVSPGGAELSMIDPPDSLFWTGGRPIEQQELFTGFGRPTLPDWSATVWNYDGPKLSAGSTPGFEVRHGGTTAKLKFRETRSEPMTARLFHALGYYADPTDHVRGMRVRYDPRMIREFNLRRDVMMHFRLVGPPLVSLNLQRDFDLLDFVENAVLRDGTRLACAELRRRLLPPGTNGKDAPPHYDRDFEARIDHLILAPVNLQVESPEWRSVGRWDYGQLGHDDLRELRAAGLLAAWLGWFDCRFDNTSLRVQSDGDGPAALRAGFSDLGGGLGRSDRGFAWSSEDPNAFPWDFTRAPVDRGPGRMRTPFRVVRFHTIASNPAFEAMTEADARWMARRIARLSHEQLTAALIASGHDAAETSLYLAKLIARRDKLLADLGLEHEHAPLGTPATVATLDYDPLRDGLPEVRVGDAIHRPPPGAQLIVNGELVARPAHSPASAWLPFAQPPPR